MHGPTIGYQVSCHALTLPPSTHLQNKNKFGIRLNLYQQSLLILFALLKERNIQLPKLGKAHKSETCRLKDWSWPLPAPIRNGNTAAGRVEFVSSHLCISNAKQAEWEKEARNFRQASYLPCYVQYTSWPRLGLGRATSQHHQNRYVKVTRSTIVKQHLHQTHRISLIHDTITK